MPVQPIPKPDWCGADIELASLAVNVGNTLPELRSFALEAAAAHRVLFNEPMVITSGNDSQHVGGSKHAQNKALDIRARDVDATAADVFLLNLAWIARRHSVGVFDERFNGPAHWHVELP